MPLGSCIRLVSSCEGSGSGAQVRRWGSHCSVTPYLIVPSSSALNLIPPSHPLLELYTLGRKMVVLSINSPLGVEEKNRSPNIFLFRFLITVFRPNSYPFSVYLILPSPEHSLVKLAYSQWYFCSFLNFLSVSWPSPGLQKFVAIFCPICFILFCPLSF